MKLNKNLKVVLIVLILVGTLAAFVGYVTTHPEVITKVRSISPATLLLLLAAYVLAFISLILVLRVSLQMYGKTIAFKESSLLNAYSSLINFFGPGQSGAAVRGIYLKKRHGFKLKSYALTTLLYYGFYAVTSAFLLFVGSRPWWQTVGLMVSVAVCSIVVIKWYAKKSSLAGESGINPKNLALLFAATALQIFSYCIIYYLELASIDPTVSIAQALTYTGAANFALFVSLTPGAIGIREAFLVFSQNLHHISNTIIVAANLIDRAVYLLFLGLLFILVLVSHAKDKLHLTTSEKMS